MTDRAIPDAAERARALDTGRSFIVQAPAGSGKTELLVQRFLALLAQVDEPEQIVAVTFTRKAAAEMRLRIAEALRKADEAEPSQPHARQTWRLARAARERADARHWHLLEDPGRLRVQTLDSLCAMLARRMPWLARLAPGVAPTEASGVLYRDAARRTLALVDCDTKEWRDAVIRLLRLLDNDADRFVRLLAALLGRRAQWLRHVFTTRERTRDEMERVLRSVIEAELAEIRHRIPAECHAPLAQALTQAGATLAIESAVSPIVAFGSRAYLPDADAAELAAWQALPALLLTTGGEWRKSFDKRVGFPPASGGGVGPVEKATRLARKAAIEALVERLKAIDGLCESLVSLRDLPAPGFSDAQWSAIEALVAVLPMAAALLREAFAASGHVDFTEVSVAAIDALGDPDAPSDLALALDQGIAHLLVDEFQDTSREQIELLERLTAGWTGDDGRTLFLVGDPMQSIYRFREADVGIFIEVQREGVGGIVLENLRLSANFRSRQALVAWANETFATVFPPCDDPADGAVTHAMSHAVRDAADGARVFVHALTDAGHTDEARCVLDIIRETRARHESARIAVLVSARSHLSGLLAALDEAGLRYRASGIDPLADRPVVRDLMSLARALLHPADRIAWLAVLRAPFVGLLLADLLVLGEDSGWTIAQALRDPACQGRLSPDGRQRIARFMPWMDKALDETGRRSLARRVEGLWIALGGPSFANATEQAAARAFFDRLESRWPDTDAVIPEELAEALRDLKAPPDPLADDRLEIMTIHHAKGLEFDTVIVPGIARKPPHGDKPLLQWLERREGLLLAPLPEAGRATDRLGQFIARHVRQGEDYERQRVAYVAVTRARESLHLVGLCQRDAKEPGQPRAPAAGSLLETLWPVLCKNFTHACATPSPDGAPVTAPDVPAPERPFVRASAAWNPVAEHGDLQWAGPPAPAIAAASERPEYRWAGLSARRIGKVVHRLLERIALEGPEAWTPARLDGERVRIERMFAALGADARESRDGTDAALDAVHRTLRDGQGRWLLAQRAQAHTEWALTGLVDGELVHAVIDRAFVEEGVLWIADWKTGMHEGARSEEFLAEEKTRYAPQLRRYATLAGRLTGLPVRTGLYFPRLSRWIEIEVEPESA